jgi:transcriptional regulator NrdR family protein
MAKAADRLAEVELEVASLESALAKLEALPKPPREYTEVVRQLRISRQERYRLQVTAVANRMRNPVKRLRALAGLLYDVGNSTAAPKLEQQANDLELDLARLKQQQAEAELEDIDSDELVDFICDAVEDEKDLGVELAAQVYRALRNREDFEDIVDACAE